MTDGTYFTITVDTEADNAWSHPDRISLKNMRCLPNFQAICEANGIIPTYLLAYECATREEAVEVIKPIADRGACEIGYHFHAWTTPPFEKESPAGVDAKWLQAYQYELPDGLFYEKAHCLYEAIRDAYGIEPTAHRAGRWGIDQRTIDWLIDMNFTVDTSIIPLRPQPHRNGRCLKSISKVRCRMDPFLWHTEKTCVDNNQTLVEMPLTVFQPSLLFDRLLVRYAGSKIPGNHRALHLYYRRIGCKGQLRPNPCYPENALYGIIKSNINSCPKVLNMMIHSSELMAGESPFSETQASCNRLWQQMRSVFEIVKIHQVKSLPISEIAKTFERYLNPDENSCLAS